MKTPKKITLTTTDFELIKTTYDNNWFTFYCDNNVLFATKSNPWTDEQIPITANEKLFFKKPKSFYIKWNIWDNVFLTPFDN